MTSFVHSMHTGIPEHAGRCHDKSCSALQPNRPSMWAHGFFMGVRGAETQNLPGFVGNVPRAQPRGKLANWGTSFRCPAPMLDHTSILTA